MTKLPPNDAPSLASQASPHRVLLTDDDEDIRVLLAVHLRKAGYHVIEFGDGESLLDYIGTLMLRGGGVPNSGHPVILDVKMPGFSGLQILASLRRAGWKSCIVIITALRNNIETEALRLGATALVHKPLDADEVVEVLRRIEQNPAAILHLRDAQRLTNHLRQFCM